jgi:pimeloyl-ACP methyl ester carboxylesterase
MPNAACNGLTIEYEEFGPRRGTPLLLVMGLGAQMILWDEEFCGGLVTRGHRVIRFDNRDVGLSTKLVEAGTPNVFAAMTAGLIRGKIDAPYILSDMAADAVGLLDALAIASAHVVGASLGGMIAQTIAIEHPARVRSLTSIMSTTGDRSLPTARPEAMAALLSPVPSDRDGNVERALRIFRTIGSPGFPFDEERVRGRAERSYDRCFHPAGAARQLIAIAASGSRRKRLADVRVPSLVIHGADDPLIPVECGVDTAAAIPGAELLIIEGMGHDLPRGVWPRVIDAIDALVHRAEG